MNKFSSFLTIAAMLMGVANAVSSATATLDEFKSGKFQGPKVGVPSYSHDNGGGAYVATTDDVDRGMGRNPFAHDGVGEDPKHLTIGWYKDPRPEIEGSGFLTLEFISGFSNVREVGVFDLISDANKWRQTYSEDGALEFVLGDYSSSSKVFIGGSRGGLGMTAGVSPELSRIPFGDLDGKWVDTDVSVSYQDSPTIPLPLPSAVWLFGFTLFVFVVLSTRRQV